MVDINLSLDVTVVGKLFIKYILEFILYIIQCDIYIVGHNVS